MVCEIQGANAAFKYEPRLTAVLQAAPGRQQAFCEGPQQTSEAGNTISSKVSTSEVESHFLAQTGLELTVDLPHPPELEHKPAPFTLQNVNNQGWGTMRLYL